MYVCIRMFFRSGENVAPLSEAAQRDLTLASITIKYTQSNSVGYSCAGQMVRRAICVFYIHTY